MNRLASVWVSAILLCGTGRAEDAAPWDRAAFLQRIRLIPTTGESAQMAGLEYFEKENGALKEPERALLLRSDDGKWRVFEDDWIRFQVPDDPLMQVEVVTPREARRLRVVGGAVGDTDHFFERAYRLTVGDKLPYGIILVRQADWFDDGICLCGAIVFEKFQWVDGNLLRYSLLEKGSAKKVQALGKERRAVLFEWTHSAISQQAYARIGASLRVKEGSARTRDEWIALAKEREPGRWAGIGWLERGDNPKSIVKLLGEPNSRTERALIYVDDECDSSGMVTRHTLKVPLRDGVFRGFAKEWIKLTDVPPKRGTAAWAGRLVDPDSWQNRATTPDIGIPGLMPTSGKSAPKLSKDNRELIFARFLAVSDAFDPRAWDDWCRVMESMAERGIRDKRVVPAVRRHFFDPRIDGRSAAEVLKLYKPEDLDDLFAGRLRVMLDNLAEQPIGWYLGAAPLYENISPKYREFTTLVRDGLKSKDDQVFSAALIHAKALPEAEAREAAREALKSNRGTEAPYVARDLLARMGNAEDLPFLRERLRQAKGEFERDELEKVISEIEKR